MKRYLSENINEIDTFLAGLTNRRQIINIRNEDAEDIKRIIAELHVTTLCT